jgi:hypothetical protein
MVKESTVNFKDPKLSQELDFIHNNRSNSLVSIDKFLSKFLSKILK